MENFYKIVYQIQFHFHAIQSAIEAKAFQKMLIDCVPVVFQFRYLLCDNVNGTIIKKIQFFSGDIDIVMAIGDSLTSATVCLLHRLCISGKNIFVFLVCEFGCSVGGFN